MVILHFFRKRWLGTYDFLNVIEIDCTPMGYAKETKHHVLIKVPVKISCVCCAGKPKSKQRTNLICYGCSVDVNGLVHVHEKCAQKLHQFRSSDPSKWTEKLYRSPNQESHNQRRAAKRQDRERQEQIQRQRDPQIPQPVGPFRRNKWPKEKSQKVKQNVRTIITRVMACESTSDEM